MHRMSRLNTSLLLLIAVMSLCPVSSSDARSDRLEEMSFSLAIESTHVDFLIDAVPYDSRLFYYGVSWQETLNRYLKFAAHTGMVEISQSANPLPAARLRSGRYIGVTIGLLPVRSDFMDISVNYEYAYHNASGSTFDQSSNLSWASHRSEIELLLRPAISFSVKLAADLTRNEGEQRDSGALLQVLPLGEAELFSQRLGLELQLEDAGAVGLDYLVGDRNGSRIYFLRRFY